MPQVSASIQPGVAPLLGVLHAGLEVGVGDCRDVAVIQKDAPFGSLGVLVEGETMFFFLDSCAQFLAVAEHRLIPARARSLGHQLRKADRHSVWAHACQDQLSGGHTGVGVISLCGPPLSAPSLVTTDFQEFSAWVGL